MNQLRQKLLKISLIRFLSSLKVTVTCLFLFFLLTFWGTVYQAEFGLYEAQQKFFYSFFFPIIGSIPFPGGRFVLWALFINLLFAVITRFRFSRENIGILIIHTGLLTFFVASFITFHVTQESNLSLMEGEGANVSQAYSEWELAVWNPEEIEQQDAKRKKQVFAYDTKNFKEGTQVPLREFGFDVLVQDYYRNSEAYTKHKLALDPPPQNQFNIQYLEPIRSFNEPEKNMPGLVFEVIPESDEKILVLLYGGEGLPTAITIGEKTYHFQLQRKRFPLPLFMRLVDFRKEVHPGTDTAKSFESTVEIETPGGNREAIIFMNNPLRYKGYTFFQASYSIDQVGRETSTFAVVKNAGRVLPYIATFLTFLGLATHFILMFVKSIRNRR